MADSDDYSLRLARQHAEAAGVADDVHFQRKAFADLSSKRAYGCVIANPPYSERMGSTDDVADLYRAVPDVLRRLKTWSHFILTAFPDFGLSEMLYYNLASIYQGLGDCSADAVAVYEKANLFGMGNLVGEGSFTTRTSTSLVLMRLTGSVPRP